VLSLGLGLALSLGLSLGLGLFLLQESRNEQSSVIPGKIFCQVYI